MRTKKAISVLLLICMLMSMLPLGVSASAAEPKIVSGWKYEDNKAGQRCYVVRMALTNFTDNTAAITKGELTFSNDDGPITTYERTYDIHNYGNTKTLFCSIPVDTYENIDEWKPTSGNEWLPKGTNLYDLAVSGKITVGGEDYSFNIGKNFATNYFNVEDSLKTSGTVDITFHNKYNDLNPTPTFSEGKNDVSNGDNKKITYSHGATITPITLTNPDNYIFKGWTDGNGTPATFPMTANPDMTTKDYNATWTKLHTVTFDTDGGNPTPDAQKVADGEKATDPSKIDGYVAPTKEGMGEFFNWFEENESNYENPFNFEEAITGNKTLYASYNADVTFNLNGGEFAEGTDNPMKINPPYWVSELPTPTKAGYTFLYWTWGPHIIAPTAENAVKIDTSRTFDANWEPNTYTITYIGLDGQTLGTQNVVYGTTFGLMDATNVVGYDVYWTLNDAVVSSLCEYTWTENITLYAKPKGDSTIIKPGTFKYNEEPEDVAQNKDVYRIKFETTERIPETAQVQIDIYSSSRELIGSYTKVKDDTAQTGGPITLSIKKGYDKQDGSGKVGHFAPAEKHWKVNEKALAPNANLAGAYAVISINIDGNEGALVQLSAPLTEGEADNGLWTVTYYKDAEKTGVLTADVYSHDATFAKTTLVPELTAGEVFKGWTYEPAIDNGIVTADVVATPIIETAKYTVTFITGRDDVKFANGNNPSVIDDVPHGFPIKSENIPALQTNLPYASEFYGWSVNGGVPVKGEALVTALSNITGDTIVTGIWKDSIKTIKYYDDENALEDGTLKEGLTPIYTLEIATNDVDGLPGNFVQDSTDQSKLDAGIAVTWREGYRGQWRYYQWNNTTQRYDQYEKINVIPENGLIAVPEYYVNKYELTFYVDGEQLGETQKVEYNTDIANLIPTVTAKGGYTLSDWTWTTDGAPDKMPAEDVKAYRVYNPNTYTITIGGNDSSSFQYTIGNTLSIPYNPTKEGHTFNGWMFNGTLYEDISLLEAAIKLHIEKAKPANLTKINIAPEYTTNQYSIIYNVDGGAPEETFTFNFGDTISEAAKNYIYSVTDITKAITPWVYSETIPSNMPANNIYVTATTYTKTNIIYTINFFFQNIENVEYPTTTEKTMTIPGFISVEGFQSLAYPGFTFSHIGENNPIYNDSTSATTGTINVYYARETYNITYKIGEAIIATVPYKVGADVTPYSTEQTQKGYTFEGWYNEPTKMPAEHVTVTGKFKLETYKITYLTGLNVTEGVTEVNMEEDYAPTEYDVLDNITIVGTYSYPGMDFLGWVEIDSAAINGVITINGEEYNMNDHEDMNTIRTMAGEPYWVAGTETGDKYFMGVWDFNGYYIVYHSNYNGDETKEDGLFPYNTVIDVATSETFYRPYYTLVGWATEPGSDKIAYYAGTKAVNVDSDFEAYGNVAHLYAVWSANETKHIPTVVPVVGSDYKPVELLPNISFGNDIYQQTTTPVYNPVIPFTPDTTVNTNSTPSTENNTTSNTPAKETNKVNLKDTSAAGNWKNPFTDVSENASYYNAVRYVYMNGLFKGMSATEFGSETTMTRAMYVTVLGRLLNIDAPANAKSNFKDVPSGQWYTAYVNWAGANGLVFGDGAGNFMPNKEITREEMMVIIYRFAKYCGFDTSNIANVKLSYRDTKNISDWAIDAVKYCKKNNLTDVTVIGNIYPTREAKRYEVAEIIYKFMEFVAE